MRQLRRVFGPIIAGCALILALAHRAMSTRIGFGNDNAATLTDGGVERSVIRQTCFASKPMNYRHTEPVVMLKVSNDSRTELTALHFFCAFHQARKVISYCLLRNRLLQRVDNGIGCFHPAHVAQHHLTTQDD